MGKTSFLVGKVRACGGVDVRVPASSGWLIRLEGLESFLLAEDGDFCGPKANRWSVS